MELLELVAFRLGMVTLGLVACAILGGIAHSIGNKKGREWTALITFPLVLWIGWIIIGAIRSAW